MADRDRTSRQSPDELGDRNSMDQSSRDLRDSSERVNDSVKDPVSARGTDARGTDARDASSGSSGATRSTADRTSRDASSGMTPRLDEDAGDDVGMRGRNPGRSSGEGPR